MDINFNINFDRIVKFSRAFWIKVGSLVVRKIREDAGQGVFQTDEPYKRTYSKRYAELKANRMKAQTGKNSNGKPIQKRSKDLEGVSITSTNTAFVDMTLTGQTLRGLHVVEGSVTEKGVSVAYHPRDVMKIVGNQKPGLNRRLVGLNKANADHIRDMLIEEIEKGIKQDFVGKVTIDIKI